MNENPWNGLVPPNGAEMISARRVDANLPWDFFWAVDSDSRCLLVLRLATGSKNQGKMPKLRGIEVFISHHGNSDLNALVFRLLDAAQRNLFYRLCSDIIRAASVAASEAEAARLALARTWRWHHLLGRGNDERLTEEEQKGLIGELAVLDRLLLEQISAADAVMAWRGPLGAPKDFELGRICIEAKARRGGAAPNVTINSEHQLDPSGIDALFLFVMEIARAPSDFEGSMSVIDVAERIRHRIAITDPGAAEDFVLVLEAAGLRGGDDYSDVQWVEGSFRLYRVDQGFPCIVSSQIPGGVSRVRYSLSLKECEPFLVSEAIFSAALKESYSVE